MFSADPRVYVPSTSNALKVIGRCWVAASARRRWIGASALWRTEVDPFTEKQIKLVKTFADQAVIAIENVRLFQELQERNRISRGLRATNCNERNSGVIASSPTDIQPVLDAVAENAARCVRQHDAHIFRVEGDESFDERPHMGHFQQSEERTHSSRRVSWSSRDRSGNHPCS